MKSALNSEVSLAQKFMKNPDPRSLRSRLLSDSLLGRGQNALREKVWAY